jgi:DNA-binding response OmpR family regulator
MTKILLIEDDESLGPSLKKSLENEGHEVILATNLEEAHEVEVSPIDMVILDWMLPDGQGIDYLTNLRKEGSVIPVIMLTARAELIDKVVGLETGANDYMTKPFEPRELLARIRVQLRAKNSSPLEKTEIIELGDLKIITEERTVFFEDLKVELTKMEYELLKLMAESPNRAFSREEILNKVWGFENYPTTRTVDTHILQLRQKFRDNLFETVRGIGYKLCFS